MSRALAALALTVAALAAYVPVVTHARFAMDDFKAFYCAGRVVIAHGDPYATAPAAACEATPASAPLFVAKRGFVLPAPLPGYAIAAFAALAWLPFEAAVVVWMVLLVAATVAAIALLQRLGAGDAWTILVAFAVLLVAISWPVGELPPFALAGVALAAWGVRSDRPAAIGCGVALSMLEPQAGLALAIAAIARSRRTAVPAVIALAALGVISLATLGVRENIAYVHDVLPAHVRAELPAYFQYSLSWMLNGIGVAPSVALLAGRLWWIGMLGVAAYVARTPFAREHPEAAMLAAPAFALVGGPFLHLDHLALALPAALWLAARRVSWWSIAAVAALAMPLLQLFISASVSLLALALIPLVALWIGTIYGRSFGHGLATALGAIVVAACGAAALLRTGFGFTQLAAPVEHATLAQAPWTQFVASHYVMSTWGIWAVKAPIWFGLAATATSLLILAGANHRTAAR